jgi:hypothetical protein
MKSVDGEGPEFIAAGDNGKNSLQMGILGRKFGRAGAI